uniref:Uncharacterized protein n=1 Tax=Melopsittacus undulatus TaxID=13146 RepID=A0A8C6NFU2_MELUD
MSAQDTEDFGAGNLSEKSRMLPSLPPYDMDEQLIPRERRSTWCCLAWTLLLATMNLLVFVMNLLLMFVIFTIVLLPTIVVVYFGFQCHSQVMFPALGSVCNALVSSSALIILGFVIMSPLIVVAMAIYCSLAKRLRLFLCFQPYSRAVYKGVKWCWYEEGGLCSCWVLTNYPP